MASVGQKRRRNSKPDATKPKHTTETPKHHLQNLINIVSAATSSTVTFLSQNDLNLLPSQTLTLESLLSSTSTSLSFLISLLPLKKPISLSRKPSPSLRCWFHRFLQSATADYDSRWIDAFRMSKPSFTLLLRLLAPSLQSLIPSLHPTYTLAAGLYRLAHAASYKAVARRFAMDFADACRAFYVVCKVVNEKLGHLFEFGSDVDRIVVGFGWISLPNCCGVLGFERFSVDGELLVGNEGLIAQALVDSEGRFLDVSAGWPSKMSPETIFRQTKLFSEVDESSELLNGPSYNLDDGSSIPQYILGDSCFPLLPWLLTPYMISNEPGEDNVNPSETAFNSVHKCAMGLVHNAFGRVKARWQLLSKTWNEESIEFLPFVIITGCLLHNFLNKCSESLPDKNEECEKEIVEFPAFEGDADEIGQHLRGALALHLSRVSTR